MALSQATGSASRWLVGSSSSGMSGLLSAPAERHAARRPTACRPRPAGRAAQRVHGDLDGAAEVPAVAGVDLLLQLSLLGGQLVMSASGSERRSTPLSAPASGHGAGALHVAHHVLLRHELGLLPTCRTHALGRPLAGETVVGADPQQGRLPAPFRPNADFRPRQGQPDVLGPVASGVVLFRPYHIDVLIRGRGGSGWNLGSGACSARSLGFNDDGRNVYACWRNQPSCAVAGLSRPALRRSLFRRTRAAGRQARSPAVYRLSLATANLDLLWRSRARLHGGIDHPDLPPARHCWSWWAVDAAQDGAAGQAAQCDVDRRLPRLALWQERRRRHARCSPRSACCPTSPCSSRPCRRPSGHCRTDAPEGSPGVCTDTSLIVSGADGGLHHPVRRARTGPRAAPRHVLAIAFRSVVKLLACDPGPFVLFVLFDGPASSAQVGGRRRRRAHHARARRSGWSAPSLSAMAFLCLPRHSVAVVEHGHPASLRTALAVRSICC